MKLEYDNHMRKNQETLNYAVDTQMHRPTEQIMRDIAYGRREIAEKLLELMQNEHWYNIRITEKPPYGFFERDETKEFNRQQGLTRQPYTGPTPFEEQHYIITLEYEEVRLVEIIPDTPIMSVHSQDITAFLENRERAGGIFRRVLPKRVRQIIKNFSRKL